MAASLFHQPFELPTILRSPRRLRTKIERSSVSLGFFRTGSKDTRLREAVTWCSTRFAARNLSTICRCLFVSVRFHT